LANKRTIVEINGRKYDANTGQIITDTPTASQVIDGFTPPAVIARADVAAPSRNVMSSANMHQKPQRTQKLHPAAAKRMVSPKRVIAKSNQVGQVSQTVISGSPQIAPVSDLRQQRASLQQRSALVSKFSVPPSVQEAPNEPAAQAFAANSGKPINDMAPAIAQPLKRPMQRSNPSQLTRPGSQNQSPAKVVESDAEPGKGRFAAFRAKRPKLIPTTITILMVLAATGYFTYKSIPNMALRVAAQRAGFNASLPGYNPSGFSFSGPVAYSQGVVELAYESNSDERNYKLIQRESSWDSQSLLDNYVGKLTSDYLTFQERGLTVYIYDTSNATWVDGGIWYTIEGNANLSSEQLLKIAGSL
jgi:hypothetical protein